MPRDKESRQIFSVSKKYEEVFKVLESMPNKSAFICEAILAYNKTAAKTPEEEDHLQSLVKQEVDKALQELVKENLFIVKGNPDAIIQTPIATALPQVEVPQYEIETQPDSPVEEVPTSPEEDEEYDLIMSISNQW